MRAISFLATIALLVSAINAMFIINCWNQVRHCRQIAADKVDTKNLCNRVQKDSENAINHIFINDESKKNDAWAFYQNLLAANLNPKRYASRKTIGMLTETRFCLDLAVSKWRNLVKMNPNLGKDVLDQDWFDKVTSKPDSTWFDFGEAIYALQASRWQYVPEVQVDIDRAINDLRDAWIKQEMDHCASKKNKEEQLKCLQYLRLDHLPYTNQDLEEAIRVAMKN